MQEMTLKLTRELRVFYNEHNENCTNCGSSLSEGDCVHLGYLSEDRHAVLCDKCCHLLSKTVIRYHWMEKEYTKPAPEEKLWRYMDLSKFISLISTKQLYFASASSFDDPFEGAKGLQKNKTKWDNYYLDFFEKAVRTAPGMDAIKLSDEKVNNDAKRLLQELSNSSQASRNHTFISCWHSNEYESEAMWKLYSKDTSNAVAIQTTGKRLYLALDREPSVSIGKVKYIDFSNQYSSINGAYWYKRKSFEHEREVRAITHAVDNTSSGVLLPIDLDILIDRIYVSPYAPSWFTNVVKSVVKVYGIEKTVFQSQMLDEPFF